MATHKGSEGVVKVGANAVAEVTSFEFTRTATVFPDTALGDTAETYLSGTTDGNGTITCHWDETDTNGQEALDVGAAVSLVLLPEGSTSGDKSYSFDALITSVQVSVQGNNVTTQRTFQFQITGAVTEGTVA